MLSGNGLGMGQQVAKDFIGHHLSLLGLFLPSIFLFHIIIISSSTSVVVVISTIGLLFSQRRKYSTHVGLWPGNN